MTREQNARIAALKEDNYEEYLKLAANTKNQRLRTLLEKTGSIISELGIKVSCLVHMLCTYTHTTVTRMLCASHARHRLLGIVTAGAQSTECCGIVTSTPDQGLDTPCSTSTLSIAASARALFYLYCPHV